MEEGVMLVFLLETDRVTERRNVAKPSKVFTMKRSRRQAFNLAIWMPLRKKVRD